MKANNLKASEVWHQDPEHGDDWHGQHGVMVNTAALTEREFYYDIIRLLSPASKNTASLRLEPSVTPQSYTSV